MAVPLVARVNPNGNIGLVPATSRAAELYPAPPSARAADGHLDADPDGMPPGNASTDVWRTYATSNGLSSEVPTT